jgi:hypothetical protein
LVYLLLFVQTCAVFVGGYRYKSLSRPLQILEWLLVFIILEVGLEWILSTLHFNNLWPIHFTTLIECSLLVFVFYSWMMNHRARMILVLCFSVYVLLWLVSKFTFEPLSMTDDWTATISKVLQIVCSVYVLVEVVKETDIVWTNDPRVWVSAGIIIYSAGSLFMFALFTRMLLISPERLKFIWSFNWILLMISNLLFARAFLCKK